MQPIFQDGKTLAPLSSLGQWAKNPKFIKEENLEKLKTQIKELGVYKPLVVTEDGTILGGNQRYKALMEIYKDAPDTLVWISIVEAWTDTERLKYCLSDNLSLGEYKREELYEIIKPLSDQQSLFKDYDLEIPNTQAIKDFVDDYILGEDELKLKQLKRNLSEVGINEETIEIIEQMSKYHKEKNKIEDVEIKGTEKTKERYPLQFWIDSKEDYDRLNLFYSVNGTRNLDAKLLIEKTYGVSTT